MVAPVQKWTPPNPVRLDLSRDLNHTASFPREGRPKPQETGQADRQYRAVYKLFIYFYRI